MQLSYQVITASVRLRDFIALLISTARKLQLRANENINRVSYLPQIGSRLIHDALVVRILQHSAIGASICACANACFQDTVSDCQ